MRILLVLIAFSFLVKPVLPVVDYIFNYEYIVTNLCENRDRPKLNCNGTCYLMQSLAEEAQDNEQRKKENLAYRYSLDLLFIDKSNEPVSRVLTSSLRQDPVVDFYQTHYKYLHSYRHLRPPLG